MKAHLGFGALLLLGSACSVINSFEDVAEIAANSTGGKTGNSGGSMGGGGGDSGGGSSTGGMGNGGAGTGGGSTEAEPGLIVVRGTDVDDASSVLSVLSPQTGEELARETALFSAIAHDPRTDIWYAVRSASGEYTLEVRAFDRLDNEWTTLGSAIEIKRPLSAQTLIVLSERIAVITEDSAGEATLHVFNTSDPEKLTEVGTGEALGPVAPIVSALAQKSTLGGTLMIARGVSCAMDMTKACITLQNAIVASSGVTLLSATEIGPGRDPSVGRVALGFDNVEDRVLLAMPNTDTLPVTGGNLYMFGASSTHPPSGSPIFFGLPNNDGATLSGVAFDPCNQVAFIDGPKLNSVRAIPLRSTLPSPAVIRDHSSHPGGGLEYEQVTRTLLSYFALASDHGIIAYTVGGTDQVPTLVTRNNDWDPPADLKPSSIVAATPNKPCQK